KVKDAEPSRSASARTHAGRAGRNQLLRVRGPVSGRVPYMDPRHRVSMPAVRSDEVDPPSLMLEGQDRSSSWCSTHLLVRNPGAVWRPCRLEVFLIPLRPSYLPP